MKKLGGIIVTMIGILFIVLSIIFGVIAEFKYERDIQSYWNLAVKASTVPKKAENIDRFVMALEDCQFEGKYNALFLKTPDNSFDENLIALKTLQQRLNDIQNMDISSFEYQKAIEQITEQEMGNASAMRSIFHGIWYKNNYFFLWDWICGIQVIFSLWVIAMGGFYWNKNS